MKRCLLWLSQPIAAYRVAFYAVTLSLVLNNHMPQSDLITSQLRFLNLTPHCDERVHQSAKRCLKSRTDEVKSSLTLKGTVYRLRPFSVCSFQKVSSAENTSDGGDSGRNNKFWFLFLLFGQAQCDWWRSAVSKTSKQSIFVCHRKCMRGPLSLLEHVIINETKIRRRFGRRLRMRIRAKRPQYRANLSHHPAGAITVRRFGWSDAQKGTICGPWEGVIVRIFAVIYIFICLEHYSIGSGVILKDVLSVNCSNWT